MMQQSASDSNPSTGSQPKSGKKKTHPQVTAAFNRYMMSLPATTPMTKPTLLTLPTEIQLHIISYLSNEPIVGSPEPTLMLLRRTHSSLRKSTPIKPFRPALRQRQAMAFQLHRAENRWPELFPESYYPCYKCLRVMDIGRFVFTNSGMVFRNVDIGGPRAHLRQCADCSGIFRPGFPKNYTA